MADRFFVRRYQGKDVAAADVQDSLVRFAKDLSSTSLLNGVFVDADLSVPAVDNVVRHSLGRQPSGWFLVDNTASVNVWRTAWSRTDITLRCSMDCSVRVYIF